MSRWERFKRWVVGLIMPEWKWEISLLNSRLKAAHERLREMYWEEQAKVAAKARIEKLEEALVEVCMLAPGNEISAEEARKILEGAGLWDRILLPPPLGFAGKGKEKGGAA